MELDLGKGRIALIDDEDWTAERCNYRKDGTVDRVRACDLCWYAHTVDGRTYVWSCYRANGKADDKRYSMNLHRLITECPADKIVDHRDGNGLNNQRSNLRVCEARHNMRNTRKRKQECWSRFKGVVCEPKRGKRCWGVRHWLVCFEMLAICLISPLLHDVVKEIKSGHRWLAITTFPDLLGRHPAL